MGQVEENQTKPVDSVEGTVKRDKYVYVVVREKKMQSFILFCD